MALYARAGAGTLVSNLDFGVFKRRTWLIFGKRRIFSVIGFPNWFSYAEAGAGTFCR